MYYAIDYHTNPADPDDEGPFLEIHQGRVNVPGVISWHTGRRFEGPIATPIQIEATPHHGYLGPPQDFFDGAITFISPRMLDVLGSQGVDNLDLYEASITYTTTGEKHKVWAYNLIGLISATDFSRSNITSYDGDFKMDSSIKGLEVDLMKAVDLPIFRLAENTATVLAHKRLRQAVEAAGIHTFTWVEPKDWVRI